MILNPYRSELQTGIYGRSDRSAEGVPRHVVEPLEELLAAVCVKVFGRTVVEVGIEFVNDGT